MRKMALLSVSDRTGLLALARALHSADYELLATSGTGKALIESDIPFTSVESYTGLAELLDGRVKTLHPKIHGGILARRDSKEHIEQMAAANIAGIDLVVVNLYPFTKYLDSERASNPEEMTELVDVGGPTMIRAAAKNHKFVLPLIDPQDYAEVIGLLAKNPSSSDPFPLSFRRRLAAKVFSALSAYDGAIGDYFASVAGADTGESDRANCKSAQDVFPGACEISIKKLSDLRYGENPHQKAAIYTVSSATIPLLSGSKWKQLGGKELSYNNMLDFDAALRLLADLPQDRTAVAILKHLNPCGVALADSVVDAIVRAKQCDPRSHFGGILVTNREVDIEAAQEIRGDFAEIVVAPKYSVEALKVLETSKNLRLIEVSLEDLGGFEVRTVAGGLLVQEPDSNRTALTRANLVSGRVPTEDELVDLDLAWRLVGHVKSNAIVLVRGGLLVGVGAGQMSRIDSVELAIHKAKAHGHLLAGAVAASDAFFPFPDSVESLAAEGISCVVSPAGARRDDDVKTSADSLGVSLFFAADRHFRH